MFAYVRHAKLLYITFLFFADRAS